MSMVITEMSVSVDGYIAGPDGDFSWGVPDEELHRFHNDQVRPLGAHVLGRRLYETMSYWETADDPDPVSQDFAAIWKALPKLVFSRTLTSVEGTNTRLATEDLATELERLKANADGDIAIGGPTLAAEAVRLGLVDEHRLFLHPVAIGGGTPYFAHDHRLDLRLLETRTFDGPEVVYLRYGRRR